VSDHGIGEGRGRGGVDRIEGWESIRRVGTARVIGVGERAWLTEVVAAIELAEVTELVEVADAGRLALSRPVGVAWVGRRLDRWPSVGRDDR
jgi:hypothetical protein